MLFLESVDVDVDGPGCVPELGLVQQGRCTGGRTRFAAKAKQEKKHRKMVGGGRQDLCPQRSPPPPFKAELFQRIAQLIGKDRGVVAVNEG